MNKKYLLLRLAVVQLQQHSGELITLSGHLIIQLRKFIK